MRDHPATPPATAVVAPVQVLTSRHDTAHPVGTRDENGKAAGLFRGPDLEQLLRVLQAAPGRAFLVTALKPLDERIAWQAGHALCLRLGRERRGKRGGAKDERGATKTFEHGVLH